MKNQIFNLLKKSNKIWKPSILGLTASLILTPGTWAGDCTFAVGSFTTYCTCDGATSRVGRWNAHAGGSTYSSGSTSTGVRYCTSATDTACTETASDVHTDPGGGAFSVGETKYFLNTTAVTSPPEYFKCTYSGSQLSTSSHTPTPPAPPAPTPVGASVSSVASLVFLSSALLLIGSWGTRKKVQKDN